LGIVVIGIEKGVVIVGTFGKPRSASQFLPGLISDMRIPPWLLALVVLFIVCTAGAYITGSFKGSPEGFIDASGQELICDEAYKSCVSYTDETDYMANIDKNNRCSETYSNCKGITRSNSQSHSQSHSPTYNLLENTIDQSSPNDPSILTHDLSNAPVIIQNTLNNATVAQATGGTTGDLHAQASPSQERIYSHQRPSVNIPTMTATGGQTPTSISLAPSVRQMIRNDIKTAVRDEIQNIQNEYEISYEAE